MSDKDLTRFTSILAQNGLRVTEARKNTFRLLLDSKPQTIRQLLDKSGSSVDRVSIYRNIDLLEKLGIVRRIYIGWKYKLELSDDFVSHHHHLSCLDCGIVLDIEDESHIDEFIDEIADRYHFVPSRHQFEIEGYCKKCDKYRQSKSTSP